MCFEKLSKIKVDPIPIKIGNGCYRHIWTFVLNFFYSKRIYLKFVCLGIVFDFLKAFINRKNQNIKTIKNLLKFLINVCHIDYNHVCEVRKYLVVMGFYLCSIKYLALTMSSASAAFSSPFCPVSAFLYRVEPPPPPPPLFWPEPTPPE